MGVFNRAERSSISWDLLMVGSLGAEGVSLVVIGEIGGLHVGTGEGREGTSSSVANPSPPPSSCLACGRVSSPVVVTCAEVGPQVFSRSWFLTFGFFLDGFCFLSLNIWLLRPEMVFLTCSSRYFSCSVGQGVIPGRTHFVNSVLAFITMISLVLRAFLMLRASAISLSMGFI